MYYFIFGEDEYPYDGKLSAADAMMLFEKTNGLGVKQIPDAIDNGNPFAVLAFKYMLKRRAGEAVRWEDLVKGEYDYKGVRLDEPAYPVDDEVAENPTEPTSTSGEIPLPDSGSTT